jgi:hypothetical protein
MPEKTEAERELELLDANLKFNARVLGLVFGIIFGLITFIATNWLVIKGPQVNEAGQVVMGPHLALLSQFFIGYRVSFVGSLIGFAYSFVIGLFTGWFVSWIYNRIAIMKT